MTTTRPTIDNEDRRMVRYFHRDGGIENWASWEDRRAVIEAAHPELIAAMKAVVIAERTLDAVVKAVYDGCTGDE